MSVINVDVQSSHPVYNVALVQGETPTYTVEIAQDTNISIVSLVQADFVINLPSNDTNIESSRLQAQQAAATSNANAISTATDAALAAAAVSTVSIFSSSVSVSAGIAADNAMAAGAAADSATADRIQTGLDKIATAADRVQTALDRVATTADKTTSAGYVTTVAASASSATTSATSATTSATNTAADRVQTGLDRTATTASAAAALSNKNQTVADAVATAADRVQTGIDKVATAADRVQTGLDRTAVAANVVTVAAAVVTTGGHVMTASAAAADAQYWAGQAAVADLTGMGDVNITGISDNEVLQYDTASGKWINQTFAEADIASATTLTGVKTKTDWITVTQAVNLDTIETLAGTALQPAAIGVTVQAYSSVLGATTASFLTAHNTKLSFLSVTQAVDLDTIESLAGSALQPAAIGTTVQAYNANLTGTTAAFLTAHSTKLGFMTVTQAVNLDTIETLAGTALQPAAIGVYVQAYNAALTGTTATYLTAHNTKLNFLTITQAVDLDAIEILAGTALQPGAIGVSVQAFSAALSGTTASYTTAINTKMSFITVTQAVNLDSIEAQAASALQPAAIGTTIQAYSTVLAATTASFTTAMKTKLDFITVTQAVDLDAIEIASGAASTPFVAAGAVTAAGKVMQLRTSDGKVEQVAGFYEAISAGTTLTTTEASSTTFAYNSSGNIVVRLYVDLTDSSKLKTRVGTVAGNSISWGAANTVFASSTHGSYAISYDAGQDRFLISYCQSGTSNVKAVVGTVSSTTMSFGTAITVKNVNVAGNAYTLHGVWSAYDATAGKTILVISWNSDDGVDAYYDTQAFCMSISSTTVTAGAGLSVQTSGDIPAICGACHYIADAGKVLMAFFGTNDSPSAFATFFSISGTTVTKSTPFAINFSVALSALALSYDSVLGKVIVVGHSSSTIRVRQFTFSGTTLTAVGSGANINPSATTDRPIRILPHTGPVTSTLIFTNSSGFLSSVQFTIEGTTVAFASSGAIVSSTRRIVGAILLNGQREWTLTATDDTSSLFEYQYSPRDTNLQVGATIAGLSVAAAVDAATVQVSLLGAVDAHQTGLTVNSTYYVGIAGELTTTSAAPNVLLGRAVATTKLLITKGI